MKRTVSFLFSVMIVAGLLLNPVKAKAAFVGAGVVTTQSTRLNVRSKDSVSGSVVGSVSKGSYITLVSKSGDWWRVEYAKGKYGYCHADYISAVSGNTALVRLNSGTLNVRNGAGTTYSRTGSLSNGEPVLVLSESAGWSKILYHGTKTGFVSSQYLSAKQEGAAARYPSVNVSVPSYKQTDSRWANVTLGNSGKPISQIGCATTAIAMMESCRTGSTIYPDAMARKLSYTSSGSVYWPKHFTQVSNLTNYLTRIYELLQAGKPVLLGAKTSAGKQHWIVVTGFKGGDTLSASGFTIQDPGSNSRTDLQQFLNAYPVIYKYFHY